MTLEVRRYIGKSLGGDAGRTLHGVEGRTRGGGNVIVTLQPSSIGEMLVSMKIASGFSVSVGQPVAARPEGFTVFREIIPASAFAWPPFADQIDAAKTFAGTGITTHFVGIAKSAGSSGSFINIDISPVTIHEISCDELTYEAGSFVGMAKDASFDKLADAKLTRKSTTGASYPASACVFRVVREYAEPTTTIKVRMQSSYWGVNDASRCAF